MDLPGLTAQLHWTLTGVLLPLAALTCLNGALRPELGRAWRWVLGLASASVFLSLGMLLARHGLQQWKLPRLAWGAAPFMWIVLVFAAREQLLMLLLALCALGVSLAGWLCLGIDWAAGPEGVVATNDALTLIGLPLALAGLWKHMVTPAPPKPEPATPTTPPAAEAAPDEAAREAALQAQLQRDEAQEAADKYTRD